MKLQQEGIYSIVRASRKGENARNFSDWGVGEKRQYIELLKFVGCGKDEGGMGFQLNRNISLGWTSCRNLVDLMLLGVIYFKIMKFFQMKL